MEWVNPMILVAVISFLSLLLPGLNAAKCPPIKVRKETIIRTRESLDNGAKLLYRTDVDSSRECYEVCCGRKSCNIGVMHYKKKTDEISGELMTYKTCFLFACGSPNRCSFMNHTGYAVIELEREKKKPKKVALKKKPHSSAIPQEEKCAPGAPVAMCSRDPCERTKCNGHPHAICVPSYCGGCSAVFYDKSGKKLHCRANKRPALTFPPPTTANILPTVLTLTKDESETDNNVNEEEVEIMPEDTGGKPTEDPDYGKGTEEDPHAVKEWRTWVDSGDEKAITTATTSTPEVPATAASNSTDGKSKVPGGMSRTPGDIITKKDSPFTMALSIALIVCIVILVAVLFKLKCMGPKKKKKFAVDDGDYLINGMYL